MTAACGGGTSSAKPGFTLLQTITAWSAGAMLNNVRTQWAVAIAALIGTLSYDLSVFCTTDPPPIPAIDYTDGIALLNPSDLVSFLPAQAKFQALVANLAWAQFCKCDSGTAPTLPATPTEPANWPTINPPQIPPLQGSPCARHAGNIALVDGFLGPFIPQDGQLYVPTPLPVTFVVNTKVNADGSTNASVDFQFYFQPIPGGGGGQLQLEWAQAPGSGWQSHTFVTPSWAYTWFIQNHFVTGTSGTNTFDYEVDVYCAGTSPTNPVSPCCPPDTGTQLLLEEILGYLRSIYSGMGGEPHSYAEATVHSSLSGSGSFSLVDAALAVKATITTDRPDLGQLPGNPIYLEHRGYIVPLTAEAPIATTRKLVYNPQLFILPSLTEAIGYEFPSGLVVDVTEIVRGP